MVVGDLRVRRALEELVAAVVGLLPRRGAVGQGVLGVAVDAELASVQNDSAAARLWAEPAEQFRVGRQPVGEVAPALGGREAPFRALF